MANRTSRHLKPGQHNLKGKKSKTVCPCCDKMVNHKEKILRKIKDGQADWRLHRS